MTGEGTVTISPDVVVRVVQRSAEQVDGVKVQRRGVEVDPGRVSIELAVRYGLVLPEVAHDVQQRVVESLRAMCGLDVEVDVTVEELNR
ncbi:MAG: Asp23/Gls24 family envelope stress response protein [Gaiellaceae bacterium]